MRVGLGQMEVSPGRPDVNARKMVEYIGRARDLGAEVAAFPEMAIPGYLLGDTWEQSSFLRDCEGYGKLVCEAAQGIVVCFGNVGVDWEKTGEDGRVRKYNAFFVAQDGQLAGGDDGFPYPFRVKALQPNYREFEDTRHFYSLRKLALELGVVAEELLKPVTVKAADGTCMRLGCILCEDGWTDDYSFEPMRVLSEGGPVDMFLNLSASPFTLGKNGKRHRVFSRQAREYGVPLVYVNNVGIQNNGKTVYTFDGESTIYSSTGTRERVCGAYEDTMEVVEVGLRGSTGVEPDTVPLIDDSGTAAIYRALHYGIGRFTRAIGMQRAVIGCSGGIDSAVAACLYCEVLGKENVLLVNMPSQFNSETTKGLAAQLARNLGCLYTVVPIQTAVDVTVHQVGDAVIEDLSTGQKSRLTLSPFMIENIQARDRSARVLAAVSSAFDCGFTCNGNKAELTVGYATLYGDQAGFLASLGDLWKHQVYALAAYMNDVVYGREVLPQGIIDIVPSAELSLDQAVDEGKGDPIVYPYHDYLFRAFVERWDRATPEDVLEWYAQGRVEQEIGCEPGLVGRLFPGPKEFIDDLERWWRQYTGIGVAKRVQAPPVLAVSRRAFGFDHREAQNGVYYTARYMELKGGLLA